MKVSIRELKSLVREAVRAVHPALTLGLEDVTTARQQQNGTRAFRDPQTDDVYSFHTNGYVRITKPASHGAMLQAVTDVVTRPGRTAAEQTAAVKRRMASRRRARADFETFAALPYEERIRLASGA